MDCFAVAVGVCACNKLSWRSILRMAFFFGLFQGLMPLLGWIVGESLKDMIASYDHWVAFGLLAFIGGKMIVQSFSHGEDERIHHLTFPVLISLSVATSIDALITGLSFGVIEVQILKAASIIFIITFIVTLTGAKLAEKTHFIPASWAERIGGAVLILIGVKILLDHLAVW
ncbi:MAG: manganese efflux pump [Bacteroidales bacterium]|nr:manganese efflux pump [Bacteroidales bacterium]